jgi:beta-glucuronidase
MISRDKNRASVVIWSIGNETPLSDQRLEFMKTLALDTKEMDGSRLVSAALQMNHQEHSATLEDPLAEYLDIMSFNQYLGWYGDESFEEMPEYKFIFNYDKPVIISETGGGALASFHADENTRWSEEFQESLYKAQIKLWENHADRLSGVTPWLLVDFRSPKRPHPRFQQGWNRKGVISSNGQRKKAFYVLRDYYKMK